MQTEFKRVEDFNRPDEERVFISFDTRQHGIFQISSSVSGKELDMEELINEPDLMMFTSAERKYIKCVCAIVWRMVYDSKKPDFDKYKNG